MADLHDMMSKFVEDTVARAVAERLQTLGNEADLRVLEIIDNGALRLSEAMQKSAAEIEAQLQQRLEQNVQKSLSTLTAEGERIIERTNQRLGDLVNKVTDDLPVTIQEHMIGMVRESEQVFHKRSQEWISQLQVESAEVVRNRLTADLTESARAICDRYLFDFRSEFENHVNRTFASFADRLSTPFPVSSLRQ